MCCFLLAYNPRLTPSYTHTGRVAMLAVVGWIVQEFVRLPGDLYSEPNAAKAFFQVKKKMKIYIR